MINSFGVLYLSLFYARYDENIVSAPNRKQLAVQIAFLWSHCIFFLSS